MSDESNGLDATLIAEKPKFANTCSRPEPLNELDVSSCADNPHSPPFIHRVLVTTERTKLRMLIYSSLDDSRGCGKSKSSGSKAIVKRG